MGESLNLNSNADVGVLGLVLDRMSCCVRSASPIRCIGFCDSLGLSRSSPVREPSILCHQSAQELQSPESSSSRCILEFMQLWLSANVKMGSKGLDLAGNARCGLEGDETNTVVMKPDMAFEQPSEDLSVKCSVLAVCVAFQWLAGQYRRCGMWCTSPAIKLLLLREASM